MVRHYELKLPAFKRGFHLITDLILNELQELPVNGLIHIFIKHTSAALTINENADPTVLEDFASTFDHIVPENQAFYTHITEGSDDMPAHIKSALLGPSISFPVINGRPGFGTWQGIYLCEFRNRAPRRSLVLTVFS